MVQASPHQSSWQQGSPPIFNIPAVVLGLVAVLILIHTALVYGGENWQVWALAMFAFIPARLGGGPVIPMVQGSQYWSFLTYAFLHGGWLHLFANCLWLTVFGTVVARFMGAWRFLALSAIAAIGGAIVTELVHIGQFYLMVGASGAISGLMAAAVPIMYGSGRFARHLPAGHPDAGHPLSFQQFLHNRNALIFTAVWLVITLVSASGDPTGGALTGGYSIAWEAHIGGFFAGLAAFYLLRPDRVHQT